MEATPLLLGYWFMGGGGRGGGTSSLYRVHGGYSFTPWLLVHGGGGGNQLTVPCPWLLVYSLATGSWWGNQLTVQCPWRLLLYSLATGSWGEGGGGGAVHLAKLLKIDIVTAVHVNHPEGYLKLPSCLCHNKEQSMRSLSVRARSLSHTHIVCVCDRDRPYTHARTHTQTHTHSY